MTKRVILWAFAFAFGLAALARVAEPNRAAPKAAAPKAEAAKTDAPQGAPSRIVHVTVYADSALVTREVDVPGGAGLNEVVVTSLPQHTIHNSLYAEGSDGLRVMTTRFRTRPVREDTREEVRKLEDDIHKLQEAAQKLRADVQALEQNLGLFTKLEGFTTASTQHATEKGKLDSDATISLAKYVMEGRVEKTKELIALQQQIQANTEQAQFVQRKLRDLSAGSSRTERDAVIVVEKANAAAGKVRLNYLVTAASWRPQYKFRAGKVGKAGVQVEYLAAVTQQTGEDWPQTSLVLSTAQPMLNATPPDLMVLAVNLTPRGGPAMPLVQPIPNPPSQLLADISGGNLRGGLAANTGQMPSLPASARGKASAKVFTDAAQNFRFEAQRQTNRNDDVQSKNLINYAGALDQASELVLQDEKQEKGGLGRVRRSNEGPSVTYHLNAKLTVPSRNDEQVLEIARLEMTPDYFYKAVPVLTPHVYRQANLTNKSKAVLLPGEATMYTGTDFVGRMNLPLVAVGETFTVGFGTEPQLQVQRHMLEKSRTMQGGNQVLKYEYRILVNSFKDEKVKLQVWDRLPHAENETLGVSLVKASPEVSKDPLYLREERPTNLLRWDLEVEPESSGEKALAVNYEFKLELDRQMIIGSFKSQ